MNIKGISLFSGGLDSILAVSLIRKQNIDVIGVTFETPFFTAGSALKAAKDIELPLRVIDITEAHLSMLKAPVYGYGRNMNPCIDCHALMLKEAGDRMNEEGADFVFTGEVLGQRPMSQTRQSLHIVAKLSGYEGLIIRPLSAKLLEETIPEKEGTVDRLTLADIQGRGRKRQMELAREFGIKEYSSPAGGCLLTDPVFARRLKDLFTHGGDSVRDIKLLKIGRHLRLSDKTKIIVGRNRDENEAIEGSADSGDVLVQIQGIPGPAVLIPSGCDTETLHKSAAVCARYSDAPKGATVTAMAKWGSETWTFEIKSADPEKTAELLI
ncbi:MAG: tRNA 4-thiouridine(8) synthase ThiI [Syntrophales bacterium]|nr:tRNA 4-thiouridine(8) synthase ThiI [Syntrophales bacterium]MDY0045760.1 tRNA 4-thiouridine(8) synthase ThiI [Syntrophales bacterium]